METNDLVSIIIPCYNQAQYLEEAVQSAVNQTYLHIEIIIVNDGSPDNTQEVTDRLQKKHPEKIRIITQKNSGVSKARNNGIKEASGKYILPLDADDKLDEKMVSRCVEAMQQTNADIVHGSLQCFGERNGIWISRPFSENNILYENLPHGSSLYRKHVWEQIKGYKENMKEGYEDWEFWINAYKHAFTFHYIPEILFYYRIKKVSRDTLATKKDIYLKAKIMMNHPELYTINQVQEALETIKKTEKLADLYFYYDKNIPDNEKEWITEIGNYINNTPLEQKQIINIQDRIVGLCTLDLMQGSDFLEELYKDMHVDFLFFYAPMRYDVKELTCSNIAWEKNKGTVNVHGTIFPFILKSERENHEKQLTAYKRLVKYQTKKLTDQQAQIKKQQLTIEQSKEMTHKCEQQKLVLAENRKIIDLLINSIRSITKYSTFRNPVKKYKVYKKMLKTYYELTRK